MDTATVTELVRDVAARVVVPRFRALGDGDVTHKRPGDLVTVADREAEAELTDALRVAYPGVLVVGEEASFADPSLVDRLPDAAVAWVVDPVDGTSNFAQGSPDYGVMVAEVHRGRPVRSWIWQPAHERCYVAELGGGVTCNGVPLAPPGEPRRPYRVSMYRAPRMQPAPGLRLEPTLGSCAIDYPRLLAGEVDALVYRTVHPWDHLPGALMVHELGGAVVVQGKPYAAGVAGAPLLAAASPMVSDAVGATLTHQA